VIRLGRFHHGKGLTSLGVLAMAAVLAVSLPGAAAGKKEGKKFRAGTVVGHVYTETNSVTRNEVYDFARQANGHLVRVGDVGTGGQGGLENQHGCGANCPFLDTQGELNLTSDGRLLFAVNAGSNTVSAFRVTPHGLELTDQKTSQGNFPYSLTSHGNLLYVLNEKSLSIAGFRFTSTGKLTPIIGSVRKLSPDAMSGPTGPRQISFDNTGRWLAVTLLGTNSIDTFPVKSDGTPGDPIESPSTEPLPFGFVFDAHNRLVVSQVHDLNGTPTADTATYELSRTGHLEPISTEATKGFAACWLVVSNDARFAYVVNTGGGTPSGATISVLKESPSGKLELIQVTPPGKPGPAPGGEEFGRTDDVLSGDGRYLYVLVPGVFGPSRLDEFKVESNGKIDQIGETPNNLGPGISGLAAS
jgi:6-phosphogluconolactonase